MKGKGDERGSGDREAQIRRTENGGWTTMLSGFSCDLSCERSIVYFIGEVGVGVSAVAFETRFDQRLAPVR